MIEKEQAKDPLGLAIEEYYNSPSPIQISVHSSISDDDFIPVSYLFRSYEDMPELEKTALKMAKGSILDVGCAAGVHCLHLMKDSSKSVTGIDISNKAVDICKLQGIQALHSDFFTFNMAKYDTLLFLMNGIGICGEIERLPFFFKQCKNLLKHGGQVLIDSSDIIYMFENEDGEYWIDLNKNYYGEVEYQMEYKNIFSNSFKWLFIDFQLLKSLAEENGFTCELVQEGPHYDFLARLTVQE